MKKSSSLAMAIVVASSLQAFGADPAPDSKRPANSAAKPVAAGAAVSSGVSRKSGGAPNAQGAKVGDQAESSNSEFKIETQAVGRMVMVGPDGEVHIQDFNGQGNEIFKELLDKLPDDVRKEFEKLQAGNGLNGLPVDDVNRAVSGKVKIVTIGPDGVRREVESDLGSTPNQTPGLPPDVGALLKKAGVTLPPEAQQALEAAGKATGKRAENAGDLGSKLDKILERLEKIEKDVANLKAQKAK